MSNLTKLIENNIPFMVVLSKSFGYVVGHTEKFLVTLACHRKKLSEAGIKIEHKNLYNSCDSVRLKVTDIPLLQKMIHNGDLTQMFENEQLGRIFEPKKCAFKNQFRLEEKRRHDIHNAFVNNREKNELFVFSKPKQDD